MLAIQRLANEPQNNLDHQQTDQGHDNAVNNTQTDVQRL